MITVSLKDSVSKLGTILKGYREKKGQNQGDIAVKAGISVSMLSQIERGVVSASIETLLQVCQALELEPSDLFKHLSSQSPVRIHHSGQRLTTRQQGVTYEQLMLSSAGPYQAELFILDLDPGRQTTLSMDGHEGIEMGYVLKGKATLIIDNTEYQIKEGDSILFNSRLPHQLCNNELHEFRAIWTIAPPHVDYLQGVVEQSK